MVTICLLPVPAMHCSVDDAATPMPLTWVVNDVYMVTYRRVEQVLMLRWWNAARWVRGVPSRVACELSITLTCILMPIVLLFCRYCHDPDLMIHWAIYHYHCFLGIVHSFPFL